MLPTQIAEFSRRRLGLAESERLRFRLAPQLSLEILLHLGAEGGSAPLTSLYARIPATEKSVRSHIRALMASGLVTEARSEDDQRAKLLRLTEAGAADLMDYARACTGFLLAEAPFQHEVLETFLPSAET